MRIFQLFFVYLRLGIQNELQYRANFLIQLLQSAVSVVTANDRETTGLPDERRLANSQPAEV